MMEEMIGKVRVVKSLDDTRFVVRSFGRACIEVECDKLLFLDSGHLVLMILMCGFKRDTKNLLYFVSIVGDWVMKAGCVKTMKERILVEVMVMAWTLACV